MRPRSWFLPQLLNKEVVQMKLQSCGGVISYNVMQIQKRGNRDILIQSELGMLVL